MDDITVGESGGDEAGVRTASHRVTRIKGESAASGLGMARKKCKGLPVRLLQEVGRTTASNVAKLKLEVRSMHRSLSGLSGTGQGCS